MFLDIIIPSTKVKEIGDLSTKQSLNNTIFQVIIIAALIVILVTVLVFVLKKNRVRG